VKPGEKSHSKLDHVQGFGNDNGFSSESGKPMPLPAVVPFDGHGSSFALEQIIFGYLQRVNLPMVSEIKPDTPAF
jgi:hypothetical protein